jgi:hypothetical protein
MAKTKQTKPPVVFPRVPWPTRKRGEKSWEMWRRHYASEVAQAKEIFWKLSQSGTMTREQFEYCCQELMWLGEKGSSSPLMRPEESVTAVTEPPRYGHIGHY